MIQLKQQLSDEYGFITETESHPHTSSNFFTEGIGYHIASPLTSRIIYKEPDVLIYILQFMLISVSSFNVAHFDMDLDKQGWKSDGQIVAE